MSLCCPDLNKAVWDSLLAAAITAFPAYFTGQLENLHRLF
jgi:hypothetical protein